MLRFAVLVALATACLAFRPELDSEWDLYKKTHRKFYEEATDNFRRAIWEDNVDFIQRHNLEADRGVHTFWVGMNEYGDMGLEEFKSIMNGYIMRNETSVNPRFLHMAPLSTKDLPSEVDWRKQGYVTPVKNQLHCGSCWAFSTTGSLEGQHFKKTGKLVSLSEQNLVDCSKREGNHGCKGGLMDYGFTYIKKNKGIDTEESYPYHAIDGFCKFKKNDVGATDMGFVDVQHKSEDALQNAVATVGPISVAMDAGHRSFQLYKHGVYSEPQCSSTKLDHGVLAVGYGTDGSQDYWLVKNSWGPAWGMEGYFMLARNQRNMCGLATQGSYPLV